MAEPAALRDRLQIQAKAWWPRHLLADIAGRLVDSQQPWLSQALIRWFLQQHQVDLGEALLEDPAAYPSFNAFFSRALKPQARPVCSDADALVAPVDGRICQFGQLQDGQLLQAKGRNYSLAALLAGTHVRNPQLQHGSWMTLYLAPRDYHRVHLPLAGQLLHSCYVPGRLFSVNPQAVQHIDQLYARNERLVCEFDSAIGRFVLVLVGAGFVSGIETSWGGRAPRGTRRSIDSDHRAAGLRFARGEEVARFRMGSTVLVLLPEGSTRWDARLQLNQQVRMGERIASVTAI